MICICSVRAPCSDNLRLAWAWPVSVCFQSPSLASAVAIGLLGGGGERRPLEHVALRLRCYNAMEKTERCTSRPIDVVDKCARRLAYRRPRVPPCPCLSAPEGRLPTSLPACRCELSVRVACRRSGLVNPNLQPRRSGAEHDCRGTGRGGAGLMEVWQRQRYQTRHRQPRTGAGTYRTA